VSQTTLGEVKELTSWFTSLVEDLYDDPALVLTLDAKFDGEYGFSEELFDRPVCGTAKVVIRESDGAAMLSSIDERPCP